MLLAQQEGPGFFDNTWPETFIFPFGEWIKQLIFWAVNNPVTAQIGDIVEWPFSTLFELILSDNVDRNSIETIPWVWLVIVVFVIGSFTRNTRVGLASATMLAICGFLGAEYWTETARTIGMILVSVILCAIVGIPLGVLSGRFDGVWNVVRPTLDAMQVIHSFVFMLPFIFFFGIGEVSATMVTMVFALPPLVRLTNLGIRQVPEDVVEASRAYGATELRVLTDVQLPLARPAIMTGLNQTLLLAISMLGIAALMGAGGLGRLLFRAINNLNLGLAASGGLAFFLVAVILDRISQTEADDEMGLFAKIRQAWAYRADPEGLLEAKAEAAPDEDEDEQPAERPAPVSSRERLGLLVAAAGGTLAVISILLPWANDAGLVSSWGRRADESRDGELAGLSFNGYEASGGTIFGILVGFFGLLVLLAAVRPLLSFPDGLSRSLLKVQGALLAGIAGIIAIVWVLNLFGAGFGPLPEIGLILFVICVVAILAETFIVGSPRLGSDGAFIGGLAVLAVALGYLLLQGSVFLTGYSHGIGVYIAVIAGLLATGGGALSTLSAPYGPRRPLPVDVSWGTVGAAVLALLLVVGSAFGQGNPDKKSEYGWFFDSRLESLVTPEFLAEMEAIEAEAGDDINKQLAAAQEITNQYNLLQSGQVVVHSGVSGDGPGLGWISMALAALAVAASFAASGALGGGEQRRWHGSVLLAGLGLGLMAIPGAFILGIVRVAEAGALGGIGAFMTVIAGFVVFASGRGVVNEFRRRKIYADPILATATADDVDLDEIELELEDALASSE